MSDAVEMGERSSTNWLPPFLRPPPPAPRIEDPAEIRRAYAYFRPRILFWSTVGYGTFYFVRRNFSVVLPVMEKQLGMSKSSLGLILTLHGVIYGVSKFLGGIAADRANARMFMALSLLASAVINVFFGVSSTLLFFGVLWMLNGVIQGMGYPPCARLLTHWFSPKELATKMSFWNASHSLGGGAIVVLCAYLAGHFNSWRICFFVPALIAAAMAGMLLMYLRDTPESVGLPEIEGTHVKGGDTAAETNAEFAQFLRRQVFSNKYIWIASIANFFVYTIRFSFFDWGTSFLKEVKGIQIEGAGLMVAGFEVAGLAGMLATGYLTDKVFRGRGAPLSMISMLLCGVAIFCFMRAPAHLTWLNTMLLMATGFFVYGPQALVAVIVANLATKRAAATAVGLTSIFGYASTTLSGWGVGLLVQHYGWPPAFVCLLGVALVGAILFAMALPAKADGYGDQVPET
jgi:OPA family glycerol-3-phosphate transporter-like MFS transporter/OPA family sugar phosphate sensor protein UhpC-like MFS transporter